MCVCVCVCVSKFVRASVKHLCGDLVLISYVMDRAGQNPMYTVYIR